MREKTETYLVHTHRAQLFTKFLLFSFIIIIN